MIFSQVHSHVILQRDPLILSPSVGKYDAGLLKEVDCPIPPAIGVRTSDGRSIMCEKQGEGAYSMWELWTVEQTILILQQFLKVSYVSWKKKMLPKIL
jgi:hypothetical protein